MYIYVPFKNLEVADAILTEEWSGHASMESKCMIEMVNWSGTKGCGTAWRTSTCHLLGFVDKWDEQGI